MKYNILLMLKATPKWWVMSKEYRNNMFKQFLFPLLASYSEYIQFKVFNAEAFHASVSDFFVVETTDLEKYYRFLQELKSSKLFTGEFFELQDIVMGAENGFKEFNSQMIDRKEALMN
jgi:Darcynin, domain of unknown function